MNTELFTKIFSLATPANENHPARKMTIEVQVYIDEDGDEILTSESLDLIDKTQTLLHAKSMKKIKIKYIKGRFGNSIYIIWPNGETESCSDFDYENSDVSMAMVVRMICGMLKHGIIEKSQIEADEATMKFINLTFRETVL